MKKTCHVFVAFAAIYWMACPSANADWINLSGAQYAPNIAIIHINDDHVKIELEIFVKDLITFDGLIPDDFFAGTEIKRAPLAKRLQQFSAQDLRVIADNGQQLQANLKLIEPRIRKERPSSISWKVNPYTGQPIPGPPQDKRVLYAELIYPFISQPQSLTIIPPLDPESNFSKVAIGFMTYHQRVPLHDFKYLSEPSLVKLDWVDPWYSKFANKSLWRWQLGGVMSF
ncbi:MAG: hypothetical protein PVI13_08045, partial [Desulfobacterales bacterium]